MVIFVDSSLSNIMSVSHGPEYKLNDITNISSSTIVLLSTFTNYVGEGIKVFVLSNLTLFPKTRRCASINHVTFGGSEQH